MSALHAAVGFSHGGVAALLRLWRYSAAAAAVGS